MATIMSPGSARLATQIDPPGPVVPLRIGPVRLASAPLLPSGPVLTDTSEHDGPWQADCTGRVSPTHIGSPRRSGAPPLFAHPVATDSSSQCVAARVSTDHIDWPTHARSDPHSARLIDYPHQVSPSHLIPRLPDYALRGEIWP